MDGPGHRACGKLAWEALPAWIHERWQPDLENPGPARGWLPPGPFTAGEKIAALCNLPDGVYEPDCRPYATLPDGRWLPHCPPDARWQDSIQSGQPADPEAIAGVVALLLDRFVTVLRREDWEEAARYGGALAHFLQDAFTPSHAIHNELLHRLWPDPVPGRHLRLHGYFDQVRPPAGPLPPPRVLGDDLPSTAWRLGVELTRGCRAGMARLGPILASVYAGEPPTARAHLLAAQGRDAAWLAASAWLTAFCLAFDRPELADAPAAIALHEIPPYFLHTCQYEDILPGCLVREGWIIPMHAWREAGGRPVEVAVSDGFGMLGYMGIKWYLGDGVHARFTADIGLASRHREGQNEHTDCTVSVDVAETVNHVYAPELDYGARTLASRRLEPGAPLAAFEVPLAGARCLILRAVCQPYRDAETGRKAFAIPHLVVANPRLFRS